MSKIVGRLLTGDPGLLERAVGDLFSGAIQSLYWVEWLSKVYTPWAPPWELFIRALFIACVTTSVHMRVGIRAYFQRELWLRILPKTSTSLDSSLLANPSRLSRCH